jgi:hypothetical protein
MCSQCDFVKYLARREEDMPPSPAHAGATNNFGPRSRLGIETVERNPA